MAVLDPRASIGRRLAFYAALEIAVVAALVGLALFTLLRIDASVSFIRRYGEPPVDAVGKVLITNGQFLDAARFQSGSGQQPVDRSKLDAHVSELSALAEKYRAEWTVRGSTSPDAIEARRMLAALGRLDLIEEEGQAIDRFDVSIERLRSTLAVTRPEASQRDVAAALFETHNALRALRKVSSDYVDAQIHRLASEVAKLRRRLVLLGLIGFAIVVVVTVRVRMLIVPRLGRIVERVREFQGRGVYVAVHDHGGDEIALLANAVDAGFTSIVERDRERQRFLSVAAHELKTPLSAILGFAQLANRTPDDAPLARRSLVVVERHASRLSRIVDDVFLAASARSGRLTMTMERIDLAAAVRKVVAELERTGAARTIEVEPLDSPAFVGDPILIDHALWLLLAFALHAAERDPVRLGVEAERGFVRIRVSFVGKPLSRHAREDVFAPLGASSFEGVDLPRVGMGLFLCREVARVHGGSMHVEELDDGWTRLEMEVRG